MRLTAITDEILEEAIRAQDVDEFDSHKVIFWIARKRPRPYVQDLNLALRDEGDPFVNLHSAIGRRLAALTQLIEQQQEKPTSLNMRGEETPCELWRRANLHDCGSLPRRLVPLREMLIDVARRRDVTHYRPVADLLGIQAERLDHCTELNQALDDISTFEHEHRRPLLSVVVVHKADDQREAVMRPGDGFFKMAKRNGVQKPNEDDEVFFSTELNRAHDYWSGIRSRRGE